MIQPSSCFDPGMVDHTPRAGIFQESKKYQGGSMFSELPEKCVDTLVAM